MNENEKFGVELELITNKFSEKMEKMKSRITNFGKIAKQNFNTGMYLDVSKAKEEVKDLEQKLQNLYNRPKKMGGIVDMNAVNNVKAQIRVLKEDINTIETSKISKIGKVFASIIAPINKLKSAIKQNKGALNDYNSSVSKGFSKGIKSIKRFALSLFGIQSIWRAVSRASSAYLSQDLELSNKLQAVWIGLGSLFSTVLEKLANGLLKIVSYVNAFVKGLTGVDYLAKAMDKANKNTKATTKSTKELKGQLSGFDEINNIAGSENSSGSGNDDTSWVSAFESVKPDTSWTEKLQNFGAWVKDNWELIAVGIIGIATAIGALNLASTLASVGITGLLIPLLAIALAITGIISLVLGICELFKEGGNQTKAWTLILGGLLAIVLAVGLAFEAIPMAIAALVAAVTAGVLWVIKNWDEVKNAISIGIEAIGGFFKDLWQGIKNIFGVVGKWFSDIFTDAWNGIKKAFSGVANFFKDIWNTIKGMFSKIGTTIGDAIGGAFKNVVNSIIKFAENTINGFIKAINVAISVINAIPGVNIKKLNLLNIPKLDVGTNFVPNDQLAYIHKGEAVVPKKFNSDEYFGRGNEETNSLLRELINTIENKDTNTYLDGREIGETARNYIINRDRIMGRSTF